MDTACVLVIEDETSAREVLRDSLEAAGCRALCAAEGNEAIRLLGKAGEPPCVVLLDLMMPGMNGWDFREWLRRNPAYAQVPVVVLSAVRDVRDEAKKLGAAAFLEKPVTFDSLLAMVKRFCDCEEAA